MDRPDKPGGDEGELNAPREGPMPYVNVRILDDGVTDEQKAEVIAGITEIMVRVLNKKPESTFVVIDEVPLENWGFKGKPVSELRKQPKE